MIKIQQLKKSTMISSGLRTVHVINERTGSRPLNRVHCQRVNYCQRDPGDEQMEGESIGLPGADGWLQIDLAADCEVFPRQTISCCIFANQRSKTANQ